MQTLWQDLRFGLRMMIKAPGFTLIVMLSIALGIAVNTSVFTLVNGLLLKSVHNPERLVALYTTEPDSLYPSSCAKDCFQDASSFSSIVRVRPGTGATSACLKCINS